jgi:hypothetical protein
VNTLINKKNEKINIEIKNKYFNNFNSHYDFLINTKINKLKLIKIDNIMYNNINTLDLSF